MASQELIKAVSSYENYISVHGIDENTIKAYCLAAEVAIEREKDIEYGLKVSARAKEFIEEFVLQKTGGSCWDLEKYAFANGTSYEILDKYYELLRKEASQRFESFLFYMEKNRRIEKRFYEPRKKTLHIVVSDLQELEDGELDFLGISLPPRVGKSTLCIFFMVWVIGRHKTSHNAMSGHSGILADRFFRDVMKLTTDPEYTFSEIFPDVLLENKSSDKNELFFDQNEAFATLTCRGIDGTWTGAVDISSDGYLYVDDMIRDRTESLSPIRLENRYQDYLNVLVDRKNDGSKELMVGTRWNVLDPLGKVETENKNNPRYRFRRISALNENDESNFQYDYGVGFSAEYYKNIRERLDKNEWMAKYQQKPFIREGLLFPEDELNTYNGVLPDGEYLTIAACDPAYGGEDSLSMPIAKIRTDDLGGNIYIVDWLFIQGNKEITAPLMVAKASEHEVTRLQVEGNNGGILFADFVGEKFKEAGYRISITTALASNKISKTEKILLYSSDIKKRCFFLDDRNRNEKYHKAMDELGMYTQTGKNPHEDSVDSLVQLIQMLENGVCKAQIINSPI